jgi:hypothetical protein
LSPALTIENAPEGGEAWLKSLLPQHATVEFGLIPHDCAPTVLIFETEFDGGVDWPDLSYPNRWPSLRYARRTNAQPRY